MAADDLTTKAGRTYKDVTIIRADATGLVIQHRFGVVRISFTEISAASRQKFNAQKAREAVQRRRAEAQRERSHLSAEPQHQGKSDLQRATAEFEEQDQANAEGLEEKIQHEQMKPRREHQSSSHLRLRGEVIGVGPGWILVLCEGGGEGSYVRRELAHLPNSPFAPPQTTPAEVIAVTGVRQAVNEGESIDIVVQETGSRSELRTRTGDNYSGRYRLFRAVD
jgi:hypothetical protein